MPFILCFLLLLLLWLLGCSIALIFDRTTTISTHFCISGFLLIFLFLALHSHLLAPTFICDVSFCGCQWLLLLIFLVLLLRLSLREINWHFRASSYTHTHTQNEGAARTHTHTRAHRQRWQLWRRFGYCCYWCAYCYQIIINKSTRNALNHFYYICIYKIYQLPGTLYFRFAFPFPYLVFFVQLRRTSSAAAPFLLFYRRVRNIYYWFCTIYIYAEVCIKKSTQLCCFVKHVFLFSSFNAGTYFTAR